MVLLSVAHAASRLGIDHKTLHHWLAGAHLQLQRDPADGRKKGIAVEQLHQLAQLHQRRVTDDVPPAASLALPAALLALPEQVAALHQQLTAVQQQVMALHALLTPREPSPAPAQPPTPSKQPPKATLSSAHRTLPPRKPVHVIARVEYTAPGRYVIICPKHGILPFEPESTQWGAWVAQQSSFRFVGQAGHFTAHHEARVPKGAWRAHRQIRNRSYTLRLATSNQLSIAVLEEAASNLQAHLA